MAKPQPKNLISPQRHRGRKGKKKTKRFKQEYTELVLNAVKGWTRYKNS